MRSETLTCQGFEIGSFMTFLTISAPPFKEVSFLFYLLHSILNDVGISDGNVLKCWFIEHNIFTESVGYVFCEIRVLFAKSILGLVILRRK